jgi:hypothetical protein
MPTFYAYPEPGPTRSKPTDYMSDCRPKSYHIPRGALSASELTQERIFVCAAIRSGGVHNTERDACPAHVVKAPCSGGLILSLGVTLWVLAPNRTPQSFLWLQSAAVLIPAAAHCCHSGALGSHTPLR